jgi:hypothetical protein
MKPPSRIAYAAGKRVNWFWVRPDNKLYQLSKRLHVSRGSSPTVRRLHESGCPLSQHRRMRVAACIAVRSKMGKPRR